MLYDFIRPDEKQKYKVILKHHIEYLSQEICTVRLKKPKSGLQMH